jgi:membrane-bound ClpP family serine protease
LEEENVEEIVDEEEEIQLDNMEEEITEKTSFLEFLKWFASKYWWLLLILIGLILITFFVKSIIYSN